MTKPTVLVTGGCGYIGSHTAYALLQAGYNVVLFDSLELGHAWVVEKLQQTNTAGQCLGLVQGNLLNPTNVEAIFQRYPNIEAVLHFAAYSQVGESVTNPAKYYRNNVVGSLNLLDAVIAHNHQRESPLPVVFSSTAAVYGNPNYTPIDEDHPTHPVNPYGQSKLMVEHALRDYYTAYGLPSVRLRYFNVVGALPAVGLGEVHEPETHLVPNVLKAALHGQAQPFTLFGDTYPTPDGTCVRDYIDVNELAHAHVLALQFVQSHGGTHVFNLGTSQGASVKQVFAACEAVVGQPIEQTIAPPRAGDPAVLIADATQAKAKLGWQASTPLAHSIESAWEFTN